MADKSGDIKLGEKRVIRRFLWTALTLKCKNQDNGADIYMERKWEMADILQELQQDGWKEIGWYDK